jgi:leucyl-tRNA---protein transferase
MTLQQPLDFYVSPPYSCSYLPNETATSLFADPGAPINMVQYSALARLGFRRSGHLVYRPHCPHCSACLPIRIPVDRFQANRNQQRTWKKNRDLHTIRPRLEFHKEHFELFRRYLAARHPNGGMDNSTPQDYLNFITSDWSETSLIEFRSPEQQLFGVAVLDLLTDGISAVYSFFDPIEAKRSLGVYMILWEINEAKRLRLPYVYLGYWIRACRVMQYKTNFRPFELYQKEFWSIVQET